jgi:hypothetical protein
MRISILAVGLMAFYGTAWAEGRGYFFAAPGGRSVQGSSAATYYVGGGGELLLPKGIGAGVEAQGVIPGHFPRETIGIVSVNGYYHPARARLGKLDPFGTVGYSLAFRTGTANLWNFGAGMNYWFRDNVGLLVEFRDHPWDTGRVTSHLWAFRFGLSFR